MSNRKTSLGQGFAKKAAKEAKQITKGVVREGARITGGFIKGFFNVFNPFR